MPRPELTRRNFLAGAASAALAPGAAPALAPNTTAAEPAEVGSQRLSLAQLHKWESLRYGMFIHFGMSTFVRDEFADGKAPATTYAPDRLDVDQWVSVARDAGMKYILLTTKHVAGHCLWPSKHTDYTVANSTNKTNVVEQFCKLVREAGRAAGLLLLLLGQPQPLRQPDAVRSDFVLGRDEHVPKSQDKLPPFTTSLYQSFQTAQITELLTQFGPIAETWIDIPGVLGRGYRQFHYHHMARLQPETVIIMNSGIGDSPSTTSPTPGRRT